MGTSSRTTTEWETIIGHLRVDIDETGEAANKPLLLLLIFSAAMAGRENDFPFNAVEPLMRQALQAFGRRSNSAPIGTHLAFWHLETDGCWTVVNRALLPLGRNEKRPTLRSLREHNPSGKVPDALWRRLTDDASLAQSLFSQVLARFFNPEEHVEMRRFFGLQPP